MPRKSATDGSKPKIRRVRYQFSPEFITELFRDGMVIEHDGRRYEVEAGIPKDARLVRGGYDRQRFFYLEFEHERFPEATRPEVRAIQFRLIVKEGGRE